MHEKKGKTEDGWRKWRIHRYCRICFQRSKRTNLRNLRNFMNVIMLAIILWHRTCTREKKEKKNASPVLLLLHIFSSSSSFSPSWFCLFFFAHPIYNCWVSFKNIKELWERRNCIFPSHPVFGAVGVRLPPIERRCRLSERPIVVLAFSFLVCLTMSCEKSELDNTFTADLPVIQAYLLPGDLLEVSIFNQLPFETTNTASLPIDGLSPTVSVGGENYLLTQEYHYLDHVMVAAGSAPHASDNKDPLEKIPFWPALTDSD